MAFTISYDERLKIIRVVITGDYALPDAKQVLTATAAAVKEYACPRVVVDMRNTNRLLSVNEMFSAPAHYSDAFLQTETPVSSVMRAIVVAEMTQDTQFFENVMVNRGHGVRLFTDYAEAVAWLTQMPAPQGDRGN